jgi:hypothetical protein
LIAGTATGIAGAIAGTLYGGDPVEGGLIGFITGGIGGFIGAGLTNIFSQENWL